MTETDDLAFLEPKQLASLLHTTPESLNQQRHKGRGIPYVKLGKRVLYRLADVKRHLAANTRLAEEV